MWVSLPKVVKIAGGNSLSVVTWLRAQQLTLFDLLLYTIFLNVSNRFRSGWVRALLLKLFNLFLFKLKVLRIQRRPF